jgi:predicted pyridoxine 5'-phosphate oxidase superfamily flavin-nucleotide-binding protein
MAKITDEMARMIAELRLCYVATVTPDGRPNLSPKGSLRVVDGDHLAFADIMSPQTMRNLKSNPYAEINIVSKKFVTNRDSYSIYKLDFLRISPSRSSPTRWRG